jgi:tetratricopeptide (TPR) repeat protein
MSDDRKVCFVVMGFGKKTDYESGRTLDLDATYEAIIRPAVEQAGLRCIRADEVTHSGVIDLEMYELLLRADLVVADISTGNPNAIYELGVRHALCPNSTIVMKEDAGRLYFDLDHVSTFHYRHLGEDIGAREAGRAARDLQSLIEAALSSCKPDSPVYTFLPRLRRPILSDEDFAELVDEMEAEQNRFADLIREAEQLAGNSDHFAAAAAFREANTLKPNDPFIVQQLALATYKAAQPDPISALVEGIGIIAALDPDQSNDPETRGISGAMHKRLWLATHQPAHLDAAIRHYRRGFEVRGDYYNGENLAACYDMRGNRHTDPDEALFDRLSAKKTRAEIVANLTHVIKDPAVAERSDLRWIYATLANCLYALDDDTAARFHEEQFRELRPASWEIATFEDGRAHAMAAVAAQKLGGTPTSSGR